MRSATGCLIAPAGSHAKCASTSPPTISRMKRDDHPSAIQVRLETRERFQRAFADGFAVVGFEGDAGVARFVLKKMVAV